jgi:hypothetical protein
MPGLTMTMSAPSASRRHFVQGFVAVGRVHLVGGLVGLAQVQRRADRIAERAVIGTGVLGRVGHDPHVDVAGQFQRFADRLMRPSIMSDGATTWAPASAWDRPA